MAGKRFLRTWIVLASLAACRSVPANSQQISGVDKERAHVMLADISADIKKHYYDPKFHGVDWDAKVQETRDKIDHSPNMNMALSHLAAALDSLDDSHTFFMPPPRPFHIDFGYMLEMVGDKCFVIRVRPKSDAEAKGIKPGDEVLKLNGYAPDRDTLWKMEFVYRYLRPQSQMKFELLSADGKQRQVVVTPHVDQFKIHADFTSEGGGDIWDYVRQMENMDHFYRMRGVAVNDDLMIVKMPVFDFTDSEIINMVDKARMHKALILDLRENPGGSVDALRTLLGSVMDHDVKIGDVIARENPKPLETKSRGKNAFAGKLIVLVDSQSASASELFARVVQLEKRGSVLGDMSSGSVMRSRQYQYEAGTDSVVFFGASITEADIIMGDGKSLEHLGVTPDELLAPLPADLAAGRDPVLVRAAEIAGVKLDPEKAGSMFPFEWQKN